MNKNAINNAWEFLSNSLIKPLNFMPLYVIYNKMYENILQTLKVR